MCDSVSVGVDVGMRVGPLGDCFENMLKMVLKTSPFEDPPVPCSPTLVGVFEVDALAEVFATLFAKLCVIDVVAPLATRFAVEGVADSTLSSGALFPSEATAERVGSP